MPLEFREVRFTEIDDAVGFATAHGAQVDKSQLRANLSLVALDTDKAIVASALHQFDGYGQSLLGVHLAAGNTDTTALPHKLINCAVRKALAVGVTTSRIKIAANDLEQSLWNEVNWLAKLPPVHELDETAEAPDPMASMPAEPTTLDDPTNADVATATEVVAATDESATAAPPQQDTAVQAEAAAEAKSQPAVEAKAEPVEDATAEPSPEAAAKPEPVKKSSFDPNAFAAAFNKISSEAKQS